MEYFTADYDQSDKLLKNRKHTAGSIMASKLTSIVALTFALAPTMANAIGFGEISLHSRVGEALMAEVPILHSAGEPPIAACFSMVALRSSDFPVVTAAKPRLIRRGQSYILQLVGSKPVSEPVFAIGVRAGCGYDIEREYVLMPEPPIELAQSAPLIDQAAATRKPGRASQWLAREGQTLEDIVDAQAPASDAERQRLLKALQRANPTLDADMPLAEGTVIQPPARQRSAPARKPKAQAPASSADYAEARPAKTAAPKPAAKPRPEPVPASTAGAGGEDRLLLGAAPETPRPGKPGTSGLPSLAETEERILKLETTLHLLTQELEKMDQAIDLATKAIEAQNRLQMAQGMLTPPPPGPSVNAQAVPSTGSSSSQWLELLLSAAIGAGIAVGAAQYLGRRRRYPGDDEAPLAFSGYRAEVTPSIPPRPSTIPPVTIAPASAPTAAPTATLDRPLGRDEGPDFPVPTLPEEVDILLQPEPEVIEAKYEDEHSVLALAEIMLSFGRLRGAADTLAEHIEQTMPDSIEPWSMLLDLYRRGGMREEFEALAGKMRGRFNAATPSWNESTTPISGLKSLEDFPHVIQRTSTLWGRQEGVEYLYSLVHDTRAGQRNGFPLEVVEEIALLLRILVDGHDLTRPGRS